VKSTWGARGERDVEKMVSDGTFRDDVLAAWCPSACPHCARADDLPFLVEHLLAKHDSGEAPMPAATSIAPCIRPSTSSVRATSASSRTSSSASLDTDGTIGVDDLPTGSTRDTPIGRL
jgi:hypothetical protein